MPLFWRVLNERNIPTAVIRRPTRGLAVSKAPMTTPIWNGFFVDAMVRVSGVRLCFLPGQISTASPGGGMTTSIPGSNCASVSLNHCTAPTSPWTSSTFFGCTRRM